MAKSDQETKKEPKRVIKPIKSIIWPITLLSILFFLGQYAYQIYHHTDILLESEVYTFFTKEIVRSGIIDLSMVYFLLVHIAIMIAYILLVWLTARCIGLVFKWTRSQMRHWGIFIWFIFTLTAWLANEFFYPHSDFSFILNFISQHGIQVKSQQIQYVTLGFAGFCSIFLLVALLGILAWCAKKLVKIVLLIACLGGFGVLYYNKMYLPEDATPAVKQDLPNIVLINLNSLNVNELKPFNPKSDNTFYLNNFLKNSTVFTKNISPSLQEFPTLISIFTGQYPNTTGIISNHMPLPQKIIDTNLITIAGNKGYKSIYIADNSRKVKMRELASFDHIDAPPDNFGNMLLGESNDFVIPNLLTNTPIGKYLFPYSYGNRSVAYSYNPGTLLDRVKHLLENENNQSLFMVFNMSLAHWPYGWRNSKYMGSNKKLNNNDLAYNQAIKQLDMQFNDLMHYLQKKGILEKAIVIVFTDKSGKFKEDHKNLLTQENYTGTQDVKNIISSIKNKPYFSNGFNTLLAFRLYGSSQQHRIDPVTDITSSIDIFPTLTDFMRETNVTSQGNSLLPLIQNQTQQLPNQTIHFETGVDINHLALSTNKLGDYLKKGLPYFKINCCTGIIEIKDTVLPKIQTLLGYGLVQYPHIIIHLPPELGVDQPILYNIPDKTWTINEQFIAN